MIEKSSVTKQIDSSPCSQRSVVGSYTEPVRSNSHFQNLLL